MENTTSKCVMVLDENLPLGLLANTAAILGITLGKHMRSGRRGRTRWFRQGPSGHHYVSVPILRGDAERIRAIRETLYGVDYQDVIVVDFFRCGPVLQNYGGIHRQGGAERTKANGGISALYLCGPKAGQQTDRKYAAAAMRALVSLQMQECLERLRHSLHFSYGDLGQDVFQKNGDPFSHLFYAFLSIAPYIKSLPRHRASLPLLFERRAGCTGEERVDLPFVFGRIHGAGDVGEVPAGRQVRPHGIEDAALESTSPATCPGVRACAGQGAGQACQAAAARTSSRMVLGVPPQSRFGRRAQNSGGVLSTRRLASSLMPRSRGWYVSLAARTGTPSSTSASVLPPRPAQASHTGAFPAARPALPGRAGFPRPVSTACPAAGSPAYAPAGCRARSGLPKIPTASPSLHRKSRRALPIRPGRRSPGRKGTARRRRPAQTFSAFSGP